jgi:hypothetical protein
MRGFRERRGKPMPVPKREVVTSKNGYTLKWRYNADGIGVDCFIFRQETFVADLTFVGYTSLVEAARECQTKALEIVRDFQKEVL